MSRTYKEHHPTAHNPKNRIPTPYLDKEIIVKNKSNELIAKCSLEDYLKRKHGDSFRQLIITRCVPDYFGGANIFNDLFYGRQF